MSKIIYLGLDTKPARCILISLPIKLRSRQGELMKAVCERVGCGKSFEKTVPWKKYCSSECKFAAWALRKLNAKNKLTKPVTVLK